MWSHRVAELPVRHPRIRHAVLVDSSGADLLGGWLLATNVVRTTPEKAVVSPGYLSIFGDPPVAHVAARIPDALGAIVQIGLRAGPGWAHLAHPGRFELAHEGTVYLDDVDDRPVPF